MLKKRSGNDICCVVGCTNTYGNTPRSVCFYKFPPNNAVCKYRHQQWIQNVKRKKPDGSQWVPTKNSKICSTHFVGGKKSEHPLHPAYAPTIFPTHKITCSTDSARFERLQKRCTVREDKEESFRNQLSDIECGSVLEPNERAAIACQTDPEEEDLRHTGEVIEKIFFCCFYFKENSNKVDTSVQITIERKKRCESLKNAMCGPDETDKLECSGFHGFESLSGDFSFVNLTGVKQGVFNMLLNMLKPSPAFKLSMPNRLLIFLMKLKLGLTFSALSIIFSVHCSTISRTFFNVLQNLSFATQEYIYWPSKDAVVNTLPNCFKVHYPNCRVIIDCTEFKIEQPPQISNRINMYSHYKGTYTCKVLIGITPSGVISFLSPVYGGKASDVQITSESGLLDKLEPNDIVLADKGFPGIKITDNILVVMPPFLHEGTLTESEVETCYNIASVRIHVERQINRIKNFHILQQRLPTTLFPYIDDIVHIVCVLVNLMNPLIKNS